MRNPLRRRLLRLLRAQSGPQASVDLAEQVGAPLGDVSYHLRVLEAEGVADPAGYGVCGDGLVALYRAGDLDEVIAEHLAETAAGDETGPGI